MRSARFIKSATQKSEYPKSHLPGIAFIGRSNVGKSSLINCLVGTKNLARTSSTPGRTQVINFFSVDDQWVLIDLPGYGFAKVPAHIRERWAPMIEECLQEFHNLRLAVLIVDARHEPTRLDRQMVEWLDHFEVPFQVVATKADKVRRSERMRVPYRVAESLEVDNVVVFSAKNGEGKKDLWRIIESVV